MRASSHFPTSLLLDLPNWVGDTMMSLPAVTSLIDANRQGKTVLNTRPPMERLLTLLFPGAQVFATEKKTSPFAIAYRLRAGQSRFAAGITFRNAYRAKIVLFLAARQRFGSSGQGARVLLTRSFPTDRERHQIFDPNPIINELGLGGIDPVDHPVIPESLVHEGRERLRHIDRGRGPLIGLAPASASAEAKRWPEEHFSRLARILLSKGCQPVILVGPGEEKIGREINRTSAMRLPVFGSDLDIAGLAGLCTQMAAVVGIDSGPMHVASMAGTGVLALFGPTDANRTAPTGLADHVMTLGLDCSPCSSASCPLQHRDCMRLQKPGDVAAAVSQMVETGCEAKSVNTRTEQNALRKYA